MNIGEFFLLAFISVCLLIIMIAVYDSVRRDRAHSINVNVHLSMPCGHAQKQIEAQVHQMQWHVAQDCQPRLGNQHYDIEVRR